MTKSSRIFRILSILCFVLSFAFLVLALEGVRSLIIKSAEDFLHRDLSDEVWHERLLVRGVIWFCFGIAYSVGFFLLSLIKLESDENAWKIRFFLPLKNFLKNGKVFLFALVASFALISVVRFYWLGEKTSYHEDEIYTIGISNTNKIGFWHTSDDFEQGVPYSGKDVKTAVFFNDGSLKDVVHDVIRLWINNNDNPHTDFYYILHRLAFFCTSTYDFRTICLRLGILHYILFAVSFYFMFLILSELVESKISVILLLFASFLNPATIGLGIFFRAYVIEETMLVVFTYVFVVFYKAIKSGETVNTKSNLIKGSVAMALTLNSFYFSIIYVGFMGLAILCLCWRMKKPKEAFFFITMFLSALILTRLLYLDFGMGFFSGRYPSNLIDNIKIALALVKKSVSENYINFYAMITIFVLSIASGIFSAAGAKNDGNSQNAGGQGFFELPAVAFVCAFLWLILIAYFCPIKCLRYCAPAFVYLCFAFVPMYRGKTMKAQKIIFVALHFLLALNMIMMSFPSEKNHANIEHLDDANHAFSQAEYFKHPEETVFVQFGSSYEKLLTYFNDEQIYYFVNDESEIAPLQKSKTYWYISELSGTGTPLFHHLGGN
ncbi:MAG: hypothetical protein IJP61_10340 [Treponema sp.]|nr:hypothetical protein [Treponema sp.]